MGLLSMAREKYPDVDCVDCPVRRVEP